VCSVSRGAARQQVFTVERLGRRIEAQSVHAEVIQTVERAAAQEVRDLAPAEVVHEGVPVGMEALARVGVLVERGAVEAREPVLVVREVRRHPDEQYADAGLVAALDEAPELRRRAEARARGLE